MQDEISCGNFQLYTLRPLSAAGGRGGVTAVNSERCRDRVLEFFFVTVGGVWTQNCGRGRATGTAVLGRPGRKS